MSESSDCQSPCNDPLVWIDVLIEGLYRGDDRLEVRYVIGCVHALLLPLLAALFLGDNDPRPAAPQEVSDIKCTLVIYSCGDV